jgi:glycosyltransferase involved in cell wall biosynthesis/GR25 family glycosyltransferase involved in LPS biosynthesis
MLVEVKRHRVGEGMTWTSERAAPEIAATYVINLAQSTQRWQDMQRLLATMGAPEPIRFEAVDGRALGAAGMAALQDAGRLSRDLDGFDARCAPGEIGCALSHAGVLADIVARDLPAALILEDDIELAGAAPTWRNRFKRAFADLPPSWELWYLYRCFDIAHRAQRITARTVVPWRPQGAAAYAVTQAGARKLLAALAPVANAVDRVYEDVVRERRIEAYAASPLLILPGSHPSIINSGNPTKGWVRRGVNRPPEYWPEKFLEYLGEEKGHGAAPLQASGLPQSIYFVAWYFDRFGGMERHLTDLALALAARGVKVTVFSERPVPASNQYAATLRAAGIEVVAPGVIEDFAVRAGKPLYERTPFWRPADDKRPCGPGPSTGASLLAALERHAERSPPSVIHVHGCRLGQHTVVRWAAARRIPIVYTEHMTLGDWGGPFVAEAPAVMADAADGLACVSERARDSLKGFLPPGVKVQVARHIIPDPLAEAPPKARRKAAVGARTGPASILAVGRLLPYKGYPMLLEAAALLRDQGVDLRVDIAGGGDQLAELEALRARLGLEDVVTFLGQRSPAEINALWQAADIGAMPSVTEGLPLALVEAMAQGRPMVATRAGGIPEVLRHEENGLLVDVGDVEALAADIRRLIEDPALAARLGNAARRAYETGGWSENAVVAQHLTMYDEAKRSRALRGGGSRPSGPPWARRQAVKAARETKRVYMFAWGLAKVGDMEALIARQAAALAASGVEVQVFVETPVSRFNRYAREMREAGVVVRSPSWALALAHRLKARAKTGAGPAPTLLDFVQACETAPPDVIHVHGWRLGCGGSLGAMLDLAQKLRTPTVFTEHAGEADGGAPHAFDRRNLLRFDRLSAASAGGRDFVRRALGEPRDVDEIRHGAKGAANARPVGEPADESFRAFCLLPPEDTRRLARSARSKKVEIVAAGAPDIRSEQLAACNMAVLSPQADGFVLALAEAMATFKPVIICGAGQKTPILHRANGLVVESAPLSAVVELASDDILAHQFAVAARRTFEREGIRELAVGSEALAIYRAAAQSRDEADAAR